MVKKIRERHKEDMGVSLGRLINGFAQGIGGLLWFAADLERQGKSEYTEQGEFAGKTQNGKEVKGAYGIRVKIGLPIRQEDLTNQKMLYDTK